MWWPVAGLVLLLVAMAVWCGVVWCGVVWCPGKHTRPKGGVSRCPECIRGFLFGPVWLCFATGGTRWLQKWGCSQGVGQSSLWLLVTNAHADADRGSKEWNTSPRVRVSPKRSPQQGDATQCGLHLKRAQQLAKPTKDKGTRANPTSHTRTHTHTQAVPVETPCIQAGSKGERVPSSGHISHGEVFVSLR